MGRSDWYRNVEWNSQIEAHFFAKLDRARDQAQYLKIQAGILANRQPRVAIRLLDNYFALKSRSGNEKASFHARFFDAAAYTHQAEAHLALGQEQLAIEALERAIAREAEFPKLRTGAGLTLAFLIATRHRRELYDRALQLLEIGESIIFAIDIFKREAVFAIVLHDRNISRQEARAHARRALETAKVQQSGFRYHEEAGLVGDTFQEVQAFLATIQG